MSSWVGFNADSEVFVPSTPVRRSMRIAQLMLQSPSTPLPDRQQPQRQQQEHQQHQEHFQQSASAKSGASLFGHPISNWQDPQQTVKRPTSVLKRFGAAVGTTFSSMTGRGSASVAPDSPAIKSVSFHPEALLSKSSLSNFSSSLSTRLASGQGAKQQQPTVSVQKNLEDQWRERDEQESLRMTGSSSNENNAGFLSPTSKRLAPPTPMPLRRAAARRPLTSIGPGFEADTTSQLSTRPISVWSMTKRFLSFVRSFFSLFAFVAIALRWIFWSLTVVWRRLLLMPLQAGFVNAPLYLYQLAKNGLPSIDYQAFRRKRQYLRSFTVKAGHVLMDLMSRAWLTAQAQRLRPSQRLIIRRIGQLFLSLAFFTFLSTILYMQLYPHARQVLADLAPSASVLTLSWPSFAWLPPLSWIYSSSSSSASSDAGLLEDLLRQHSEADARHGSSNMMTPGSVSPAMDRLLQQSILLFRESQSSLHAANKLLALLQEREREAKAGETHLSKEQVQWLEAFMREMWPAWQQRVSHQADQVVDVQGQLGQLREELMARLTRQEVLMLLMHELDSILPVRMIGLVQPSQGSSTSSTAVKLHPAFFSYLNEQYLKRDDPEQSRALFGHFQAWLHEAEHELQGNQPIYLAEQEIRALLEQEVRRALETLESQLQVERETELKDLFDRILGDLRSELEASLLLRGESLRKGDASGASKATPLLQPVLEQMWRQQQDRWAQEALGTPDYALGSLGGQVVPKAEWTSSTFERGPAVGLVRWLGLGVTKGRGPGMALSPSLQPGHCWAMQGSAGQLTVRLWKAVRPTHFTVEHVGPQDVDDRRSAPFQMYVYAVPVAAVRGDTPAAAGSLLGRLASFFSRASWTSSPSTSAKSDAEQSPSPLLLATHNYDLNGPQAQTFSVFPSFFNTSAATGLHQPLPMIRHVTLKIVSNHGHPEYTCLYRFRVHSLSSLLPPLPSASESLTETSQHDMFFWQNPLSGN